MRNGWLALALGAALLAPCARADDGGAWQDPPPEGTAPADRPPPSRRRERIRLGSDSRAPGSDAGDDEGFHAGAGPDDDDRPPSRDRGRGGDAPASRARDVISFDLIAVPWIDLHGVQEDKHWITHVRDGPKLHAHLDDGAGLGGRLGFGRDWDYLGGSIGALYLWTHHEDDATDRFLDMHLFMGEFEAHVRVPRDADLRLRLGGAAGLGGFVYDFPRHDWHDTGGLAFGARCFAGLSLWDHAQLDCSLGYLWLGYPSEELGEGAYLTISLGASF